ncbi:MAG TPA: SDR family oxidoreductase [Polyangia bacterium]|nr:SDR family oxidoreductase [Polyangia bacterium]
MSEKPHDLTGRTFLVTGANSGIGQITATRLAERGAQVFLGCRDGAKGEAVAAPLRAAGARVEVLPLDLADLASVRQAAATFVARGLPLHGLINNAGLAGTRALTRDGFELTFGVNHLGHFLLTRLLEARLREGAPARVVNISSQAHRSAKGIDFTALREPARSRTGLREYAVSKLANVLFTRELARRWAGSGVTAYALHPGVVATGIWRRLPGPLRWLVTRFMITPEEGARTTIFCATAPELAGVSGRYYDHQRESTPSQVAQDDALAARLWDESDKMVGLLP